MSQSFDVRDPAGRALALEEAAHAVQRGQLVVFPTDTVYGLGCDPFSSAAVERLMWAKGRWKDRPLALMVGRAWAIDRFVDEVPSPAQRLIEAFWPGAVTILVRLRSGLELDIGEHNGVVGIRMPDHPVALELLRETGPLAVSSTNRPGVAAATTVGDAETQLGGRVAVYLDGGPSLSQASSTIVDASEDAPRLLRPGALDVATLRAVCPDLIVDGW